MPIIQTHLIIETSWAGVTKKAKNLEHIIQKCNPLATAPPILQDAGADSESIPKLLKVQKVEEERNQVKVNINPSHSLNHLPLPQNKNIMKRQTTITIMRIIEVITEAPDPTGVNKAVVGNLIEVLNKGEGDRKTIIGANTKTTVDNSTPPMEAITTIIITTIIEVEVNVAMVVIVTEVTAVGKAIVEAITITNTINITHMMIAHRWSNMAHHVHFAVALITLLNTALRKNMT